MRDCKRDQWKRDPTVGYLHSLESCTGLDTTRFTLFFSDARCSITSPLVVLLLVLLFVPDWDWKALTGLMMFAFASGSVVLILGWVYELIKYRDP